MVILGQFGLTSAYVALAALLVNLNLFSKWSWPVKAGAIVAVTGFYFASYYSLVALLGWPTSAVLPQRFILHAGEIREPDKTSGADGEIYIWASAINDDSTQADPRAYRLAYSLELHSKVDEAQTKLHRHLPQLGELVEEENDGGFSMSDPNRAGQESVNIRFYDLPAPVFPEK